MATDKKALLTFFWTFQKQKNSRWLLADSRYPIAIGQPLV
jgi:hypothetical protein